jgi:hypothetical protein
MNDVLNAVLTATAYLSAAHLFAQHKAEFFKSMEPPQDAHWLAHVAANHALGSMMVLIGFGVIIATLVMVWLGASWTGVVFGGAGGAVILNKCGAAVER